MEKVWFGLLRALGLVVVPALHEVDSTSRDGDKPHQKTASYMLTSLLTNRLYTTNKSQPS